MVTFSEIIEQKVWRNKSGWRNDSSCDVLHHAFKIQVYYEETSQKNTGIWQKNEEIKIMVFKK